MRMLCIPLGKLLARCGSIAIAGVATSFAYGSPVAALTQEPDSGSFLSGLFREYTPRRACMQYDQPLIWLHFAADLAIALAYFTIPIALLLFVRRRRDLSFHWIYTLFAMFILACGLTHVMNMVALWKALYWLDGGVKAVTAVASVGTAAALWKLMPAAIALPSPQQLRIANATLASEVREKNEAERRLIAAREELEERVRERTGELERAYAALQEQVAARDVAEFAQAQLAALVESSQDAIIGKDLDGLVTSWNKGAQHIFGWTRAEMLGRPVSTLHPVRVDEEELERLRRVQRGERVAQYESVRVTKDGRTLHVSIAISPIRDASGHIVGTSKILRDISAQKWAEEEIARLAADSERQRRLYETILTNTPDFVYVFSLDHRVLYANEALIKMWGRGQDGAIGKTFLEIGYEPWHAEMHDREIDQVRATRQPIRGEVPFTGTHGQRQYDYIFVPIFGADGEVEAVAGTTRDVTDSKQAEQAVRSNDERLRMALAAARMVAWEWTSADRELRVSENVGDVLGVSAGVGLTTIDQALALLHPEDVVAYQATIQQAIDAQEPYFTRYRVIRPDDGRTIWIEERGHPISDQPGGAVRLYGVATDVTDRVRAEVALHAAEERSAFVRRACGIGFWYCDLPFDVLQWDELVKAHYHLPADAVVTIQTFYERIHPDDRESTRLAIERSIAERTPYNEAYRTVDPATRAVTWVRAIGRTFYAADGTPTRFDGVTLDVSRQKRAEASLRESEQRFRLVADAAPVLIWLSDTENRYTWFNRRWLNFTGRSMDMEVGIGWAECVHPDDFAHCFEAFGSAFDARTPFSREYRLRRHDGQFRWLIDNGVPRYTPSGEFDGYIGSCLDVTDYKNAEAGLLDADRRKDEFLATLAHELRNPLAPIRNGLELMRLAGEHGTIEQARSMMERQLTQMVRLVDDLLDVSRVTSGKLHLRRTRVELRAVIEAAVETSRPVIEEAGHELTVAIPDDPIYVHGDLTRLAQVVSNLLNNSAKYTHLSGHVRVTIGREHDIAIVSVADDGIGIPPAMLEKVFQMFTQVDRALEKTTGGLGIGLSLVQRLVAMHGGTIEAHSEGPGRGSEFIVRLPLLIEASEQPESGREEEPIAPKSSLRILIVDDNRDAADSLAMILRVLGNDTRTAYDGQVAVLMAGEYRPDVLLLDIGLPKLNGYEACRAVRAQPWGKSIVLIAVTGWGQDKDRRRSQEAGFDHHWVKPIDPQALLGLLAEMNIPRR